MALRASPGDAMAVQQHHGEASTSSSMSVSTTEPTVTMNSCRKRTHSETDSDVEENTKNTPTISDRFPKYVDSNQTLVELSYFKWLAGFRLECRKISCRTNSELYFGLFNFFCLNIAKEVVECRNKVNKSTVLKSYLEQTLMFFQGYYKTVKKDKGDILDVIYYDRMSSMVAYYIDLSIMSSHRSKENSIHRKTSSKINTTLFVFLDQKFDYMFDSMFQLYYVFYGCTSMNMESMLPVFKKLLSEHPRPKKMNFLTYMRYILCLKLWKKVIHSLPSITGSVKRIELKNVELILRELNVPNDFMSQYEKYNWHNWPKLTMSQNGTPDSIQRDLKNISLVLYRTKMLIKECYKDILVDSRKDFPILLTPINEQCKILRPDLFTISGEEVLRNWNQNFDDTLKPLISTAPSCDNLEKNIKYNLFTLSKDECLEIDDETDEVRVVPINDDLSKLKLLGESSENHLLHNKEKFSHSDKKCMEITNQTIDESSNDKSNKKEKSPVDGLKTLMATFESFPANVQPQSSEDDSKGSKINQCSSFVKNSKQQKICRTMSNYENNVSYCNPNQIIDSNCQNSNVENSSLVTLNNDNSELENPKNSRNINGVSHLMNLSSVKENKCVTKASNPELSITAVSNLKLTQSNFTVSDKDESIENCTKIIDLSNDQDTASPSCDIQWPIKLSHSDPYSPEHKPTIDNSEQMEIDPTSFDTEGNNSPKTEHLLSLRTSEEMISKLVSAMWSFNENEKVQRNALPMDQNSLIMNNGLMFRYPRSDSNTSIRYENHRTRIKNKHPKWILSPNCLEYSSDYPLVYILGPSLLVDQNQKEEQSKMNMAQLILQSSNNCKVHYKWPLNKTKSQTSSIGNLLEVSQSQDYKISSNILYKYTDDELNQKLSSNEIINQSTGLSFDERINNSTIIQPNQQFQDLCNFIAPDNLSPTIQSGSESINEKIQIQSQAVHSFESNSRTEPTEHQEMYRNTKLPSEINKSSTLLGIDGFEAAHYLFNSGKLFLCMFPKCTNSHHFRIIPFNAEILRHEFTVPFDYFRIIIQQKYKQLLTLNPKTYLWLNRTVLEQLTERCLCAVCDDVDSTLNINQEILHRYVEGKKPSIEENNCENEQPINTQISLSWKKHLAQRFTSAEDIKQSISQMIDDLQSHIKRFKHAFTIIFPLNKDMKINSQNLQNACEKYSDANDSNKSLNSECKKKLDIGHGCFIKDLHHHSYQYLQEPNKMVLQHILEIDEVNNC